MGEKAGGCDSYCGKYELATHCRKSEESNINLVMFWVRRRNGFKFRNVRQVECGAEDGTHTRSWIGFAKVSPMYSIAPQQ